MIRGSARNGIDYAHIETARTIKAGQTAEKVLIVPARDNDRTRPDRHVKLTLLPAGTYAVATPNEVKLKIIYDK